MMNNKKTRKVSINELRTIIRKLINEGRRAGKANKGWVTKVIGGITNSAFDDIYYELHNVPMMDTLWQAGHSPAEAASYFNNMSRDEVENYYGDLLDGSSDESDLYYSGYYSGRGRW